MGFCYAWRYRLVFQKIISLSFSTNNISQQLWHFLKHILMSKVYHHVYMLIKRYINLTTRSKEKLYSWSILQQPKNKEVGVRCIYFFKVKILLSVQVLWRCYCARVIKRATNLCFLLSLLPKMKIWSNSR